MAALAAAAGLFAINVAWNAGHHWLTFAKQFGRIAPHRLAPRYLWEFLATELMLLNPLLAAFLIRLWPGRRNGGEGRRSLAQAWPFLATSLPFVGYLLAHSLHDRIQAHWPAPVYPALALCAAFAADHARGAWRTARAAVPWFALAICTAASVYLMLPLAGIPLRFDPSLPLRGWTTFSRDIDALRRNAHAGWVGTTSYGLAAELADEPAVGAPILQISERERWQGLRQGDWADTTQPGLLVDLPRRVNFAILNRCFARVLPLGYLDRGPAVGKAKRYAAILVSGPRGDLVKRGCGADRPEPE